jgi:sulfofructosephosphate aldolase
MKDILSPLRRPSGAFAMLAIDQRESMRAMFAEKQSEPVEDSQLSDFKMLALKALTPYASAVLIDRPFAWDRAIVERAVAQNCALIAAADQFIATADEIVADVEIDTAVVPERIRADGGAALKLLVTWRPDQPADRRLALVAGFIALCRRGGLASIIEPVSRKPQDGRTWDLAEGILAAARELGLSGADLYKAEVPLHGQGGEAAVRRQCAELTKLIGSPWVVLSSGVAPNDFPTAVEWACLEGASGFLAGRAVWREVIGQPDVCRALREDAVPRLRRLCDVVDRVVTQ